MKITQKQLVAEVRKVAAANPTFVYTKGEDGGCNYRDKSEDNRGACIIGQALANLGVSNEDRTAWDNRDEAGIASLFYNRGDDADYPSDFPVTGDNDTDEVEWLQDVQHSQDQGDSWGTAVYNADRDYPNVG